VLQLEDKFAKLKERGRRKSRQAGVEETSHIVSRELLHSNILPKACGRGRVIANFGSRVMVQEIPWVGDIHTHTHTHTHTQSTHTAQRDRETER